MTNWKAIGIKETIDRNPLKKGVRCLSITDLNKVCNVLFTNNRPYGIKVVNDKGATLWTC